MSTMLGNVKPKSYLSLDGNECSCEPIIMFDKIKVMKMAYNPNAKNVFLGLKAHEQLLTEVNHYGVEAGRQKLDSLQGTQFWGMTVHVVPSLTATDYVVG